MKRHLWLTMLTCLAYCLDKELWKAIDYLKEQVWVLKEQQEKDKRILLDNHQRMRLAANAKQLTRELLEQTTVLFTPETVLSWYRRLIAQKYDGSKNCKHPEPATHGFSVHSQERKCSIHKGLQAVVRRKTRITSGIQVDVQVTYNSVSTAH